MKTYKLAALDLDGTLFDNNSQVTPACYNEIKRVTDAKNHVVISTGRPFTGLPFEQIKGSGIRYAITANGSGIYDIAEDKCIYEDPIKTEIVLPVIDFLLSRDIHFDTFIGGLAYMDESRYPIAQKLPMPESIKKYILSSRKLVKDLPSYIVKHNLQVQKITCNFYRDSNDVLVDRALVSETLLSNPHLTVVSGGYNNIEFTNSNANKGKGLAHLANYLHIPLEETIAIGDTENDISILSAAGLGIAMGNATDAVKAVAGDITLANTQNGVAVALAKYFHSTDEA